MELSFVGHIDGAIGGLVPKRRGYYDNSELMNFLLDRRSKMGSLSLLGMAKLMGLSHKAVYNWDHGRSIPGGRSCRLIAEVVGTSENRVRGMVGRPSIDGGDRVFPGAMPVSDEQVLLPPPIFEGVGPISVCECGEKIERGDSKCEWCKRDWGYREYLRWCVREGRVLLTPKLSYRMKARGYFRQNGWPAREAR